MIYNETNTPLSLAARLAEYISDPSTIRVRVIDHFGRAPSVDECRELREKALNARKPWLGSKFLDDKFTIHCAAHEGPYELDPDGYERCTVCKDERRRIAETKAAEKARHEAHMAELRKIAEREKLRRKQAHQAALQKELVLAGEAIAGADKPILFRDLLLAVADEFKLAPDDIIGHKRHRKYVDARAALAQILRLRGSSLPMIGKRMGRDHSSIVSLLRLYDVRVARNPLIAHVVEKLA